MPGTGFALLLLLQRKQLEAGEQRNERRRIAVEMRMPALGSFDARVLPHARRLREAGAQGRKELVALAPVEERPRDPRGEPAESLGPP